MQPHVLTYVDYKYFVEYTNNCAWASGLNYVHF